MKECLDQRFSLWGFGPWTPSKVTLRLVELLLEQLDKPIAPYSNCHLRKCECNSIQVLQLLWPQSVNVVVVFRFFNYFGLHFVAGKSNMIDCIFITLHKDFCGRLVLGGQHRIYLPILAEMWILHPQVQDDKLPPAHRPLEIIFVLDQFWGSKVGACDGICMGAHLNVVATFFILSCFALLRFEGVVVLVSPIWGTEKKQSVSRSIVPPKLWRPFFWFGESVATFIRIGYNI